MNALWVILCQLDQRSPGPILYFANIFFWRKADMYSNVVTSDLYLQFRFMHLADTFILATSSDTYLYKACDMQVSKAYKWSK